MLKFTEVFDWLNYDDRSRLSTDDMFSIRQINDPKIPLEQKEGAVKILRENSVNYLDGLEKAELNANLGKYFFLTGSLAEAIVYLNEGLKNCPTKTHRRAVLGWLHGIVYFKKNENIKGYQDWKEAIKIFEDLRDGFRAAKSPSKVLWYDKKIEDFYLDITQTAEEGYSWMNQWEHSHLSDQVRNFVLEIDERIKNNDFPAAYELGMGLSRISRLRLNPMESAETSVIIGMKYHRMGQSKLAIDHFQRAGSSFTPGHYHQAVTKWLQGVAQWELTSERDNAFRSWREAIDLFRDVATQTDHSNDQKKRIWLENKISLMEKSLDIKTKERLWSS
jgi:tetratricopeptide (TPR) repeat protein